MPRKKKRKKNEEKISALRPSLDGSFFFFFFFFSFVILAAAAGCLLACCRGDFLISKVYYFTFKKMFGKLGKFYHPWTCHLYPPPFLFHKCRFPL